MVIYFFLCITYLKFGSIRIPTSFGQRSRTWQIGSFLTFTFDFSLSIFGIQYVHQL